MKKVKFILLAFFACFTCTFIFAQDSTYVKIANDILSPLEAKYPWIIVVLGVFGAISEGLSFIPQIKANGVFQLVWGWIKALGPKKTS